MRRFALPSLGVIALLHPLSSALAQSAAATPPTSRILDRDRQDTRPRLPQRTAPPTATAPAVQNRSGAPAPFTLTAVRLEGATLVPQEQLASSWSSRLGQRVELADLVAISDAIAARYREAGIALFTVLLPEQDFANGVVRVRVVEGRITDVQIEGDTEGADLSLLRAYVDRLLAERPLRQATLERYLLLMNDIPGLTVGSALEPMPDGPPGANRLRLGLQRKSFEVGSGVNNLGAVPLGRVQFDVNVVANSLFRQGDQTQVIYGFPGDFQRYQYYGLNHTTPIGTDGATLRLSAGYLETRASNTTFDGTAVVTSIQFSYPVIRAIRETLSGTVSFDTLDSSSAFLGFTASDERTRVVRTGANWARQDSWEGVNAAALTLSVGLDALGARQRSILGGDPSFAKVTLRGGREQTLPWGFILRLTGSLQWAAETLPPSEKFLYGGPDFGRAFGAATLNGDRGVAGGLELAYRLPETLTFGTFDGSEVYGFLDGARVWNEETRLLRARDSAASAGIGLRARVLQRVQLQVEAASAVQRPRYSPTGDERWRIVFSLRSVL
ncbi:ShlB/FhaC/HecB family hemolysin secretion/activation protein [Muricoccus radiodurans]|uniref:ShlB/FhaC/HecB family hemolysin secretion/activation protein n=1 Tax=Muricoccus radiodurans TaxID=2231721 RepID=UPI003CEB5802